MKHLFFKKPAFTLAEVLITLVIIGVIAAATIPTLLQKHLEQEMITKLKKNASVLSNAVVQAVRENGPVDEWGLVTGSSTHYQNGTILFEKLKPYLKISKECPGSSGCFAGSYKALFADTSTWNSINSHSTYYKFILEDGTSVALRGHDGGGCRAGIKYYNLNCGDIFIDLNGKKGPNRMGVDLFRLFITDKGLVPRGVGHAQLKVSDGEQCTFEDPHQNNGACCGAHVLYKGNMDYLHKHIEDEWK